LYAANMTRPPRPVGVTVLTILQILSGLGDITIGAVLLILAVLAGALIGGALVTLLFLLDFVVIALGIFSFIMAYGLWTGKGWAWILTLIGAIIGIILGIIFAIMSITVGFVEGSGLYESLASIVCTIVFYLIILVYLNSGNVRAFFGRTGGYAVMRPPIPPPVGQPYVPPTQSPYPQPSVQQPYYPQASPQPTPWGPIACANCGAPNQPGANFCDRCGTRLH